MGIQRRQRLQGDRRLRRAGGAFGSFGGICCGFEAYCSSLNGARPRVPASKRRKKRGCWRPRTNFN
eukprot:13410799-Alexandrium_andersonii.AAC.1